MGTNSAKFDARVCKMDPRVEVNGCRFCYHFFIMLMAFQELYLSVFSVVHVLLS